MRIWATRFWADLNLRRKLSLAFIVMTLAPLLLASSFTEWEAERALRSFVFERNKNIAEDIAHDTEQLFMEKVRVLKILAANPDIKSMNVNRQTRVLEHVASQYPALQIAIVADSLGRQIARSDGYPANAGINYSDRDYFHSVMTTGRTAISDILVSKSVSNLGLIIAEPIVQEDNSVGGVLIFNVDIKKISWLTEHVQLGDQAYAYIVNKEGKIIDHPDVSLMESMADYSRHAPVKEAIRGRVGWLEYENEGRKILAGFSSIPSLGWGLIVEQPLKAAMQEVALVRRINWIILCVSAILAIFISLTIANAIAKTVNKISQAALQVAGGDLKTRLDVQSKDELGQLVENFNRMTAQLAVRGAALRQSEEKFHSLVENVNIGVYRATLDGKGVFLQLNSAMAHIFGYSSANELLRIPIADLYQNAADREQFLADARKEGLVKNREVLMRKQDGTVFWCSRSGVVRSDEAGREWIDGAIEDIDERKRAEALLRQAKEQLEIQVAERTRQLTELNAELKQLSTLDGLTCIGNRRCLDDFLEYEWQRARREKESIALIMFDIDYFKLFNDTYGHVAGDECLKKVAAVLKNTIKRTTDFASRYGGEEFVVVLPATNSQGAMKVAEKIRIAIEGLEIRHEKSTLSPFVTVSAGVAAVVPDGNTTSTLLVDAADQALYRAKEAGRNRTVLDDRLR